MKLSIKRWVLVIACGLASTHSYADFGISAIVSISLSMSLFAARLTYSKFSSFHWGSTEDKADTRLYEEDLNNLNAISVAGNAILVVRRHRQLLQLNELISQERDRPLVTVLSAEGILRIEALNPVNGNFFSKNFHRRGVHFLYLPDHVDLKRISAQDNAVVILDEGMGHRKIPEMAVHVIGNAQVLAGGLLCDRLKINLEGQAVFAGHHAMRVNEADISIKDKGTFSLIEASIKMCRMRLKDKAVVRGTRSLINVAVLQIENFDSIRIRPIRLIHLSRIKNNASQEVGRKIVWADGAQKGQILQEKLQIKAKKYKKIIIYRKDNLKIMNGDKFSLTLRPWTAGTIIGSIPFRKDEAVLGSNYFSIRNNWYKRDSLRN